jgi:outer membrane murein-binding lipoprotein Lpp
MKIMAYAVLSLGLFFGLSWIAYERVDASHEKSLNAKIAELETKLKEACLSTSVARTEAARREEDIKRVLIVLFPQGSEQIQKAFAPPQAAAPKVEAAASGDKEAKK